MLVVDPTEITALDRMPLSDDCCLYVVICTSTGLADDP